MHYLLFYDVTDDYIERRTAYRDVHLAHARQSFARGELILGGALSDPVDGAVLLFRGDQPAVAEDFARADPYVVNGLVKEWRVREWTTVVGEDPAVRLPDDRPHKPSGYSNVSPYLVADGAQRVIEFLVAAFDARPLRRYDLPDGSIMHAEVQISDSVVMIGDGGDAIPPFPAFVHLYVPDVDASYRRALDASGTSVEEPAQREGDPDRRAGVKDPAGNTWWIATMKD